jgi:hypothetical protein
VRLEDALVRDAFRAFEPRRVVHRDHAALHDLRNPAVEVLLHELVLVRAVDEEQLDRLIEAFGKLLRAARDRRDEVGEAGFLHVPLEVLERVLGVRVDGVHRNPATGLGAEPEAGGRLAAPGADLDDHAATGTGSGQPVERLALLGGQPAGQVVEALAKLGDRHGPAS